MKKTFLPLYGAFAILNLTPLRAAQGDLDPTWGGTGRVITTFPNNATDNGSALTLQGDGKVLLAGQSGSDFALVRYNPGGSLDTSFNGTGRVTTNFGASEGAGSMVLQSDGKIILGGSLISGTSDTSMAISRYNPDGSLDTSFNGTGMMTLNLSLAGDSIGALALQSDGKILATGSSSSSLVVLRLNIDGTYDTSFNGNGRVTASSAVGRDMALQPDGRIVVCGSNVTGSFTDFIAMRFNANGTLDTSFNGTGRVQTAVTASHDIAYSMTLQGDGKILLAGQANMGSSNTDFAMVRYNTDGSLDTTFNGTGMVTTSVSTANDSARGITLQTDGKILLAGSSRNTALLNDDFALVRYNTDGSLDTSFHGDGKAITHIGSDQGTAIALQPDGQILVGGDTRIGTGSDFSDFVVLRYLGEPVPEPGSSLLAASAGALLLARRRRA